MGPPPAPRVGPPPAPGAGPPPAPGAGPPPAQGAGPHHLEAATIIVVKAGLRSFKTDSAQKAHEKQEQLSSQIGF